MFFMSLINFISIIKNKINVINPPINPNIVRRFANIKSVIDSGIYITYFPKFPYIPPLPILINALFNWYPLLLIKLIILSVL